MNFAKFAELFEWTCKGYLLGRYNQRQFCEEIGELASAYAEKGDPGEIPEPPTNPLAEWAKNAEAQRARQQALLEQQQNAAE